MPVVNTDNTIVNGSRRNLRPLRSGIGVIILFLATTNAMERPQPQVTTKFGEIEGKWSKTSRGRLVANYLGIPYAEPPLGDLRFRSPQPWNRKYWQLVLKPLSWKSAKNIYFDATMDGPMCTQVDSNDNAKGSEDCLYLNIFVPRISMNMTEQQKLPVMVYVHGGAFNIGSSDSKQYAPNYLLDQNLILVTLNYRLNVFGFFSTGNTVAPGNYGIKDVVMALRWIQDNIYDFNGDPNSVTLVGHSAGGAVVHHLMLNPKTDGLFHRVIVQSGPATAPWAIHSKEDIRDASLAIANYVGCLPGVNYTEEVVNNEEQRGNNSIEQQSEESLILDEYSEEDDREILKCMRSIDNTKIIENHSKLNFWRNNPTCIFGPTIEDEAEGAVITVHPLRAIRSRQFRDIPWIIGVAKDEGLVKTTAFFMDDNITKEFATNFEEYLPYFLEFDEIVTNKTYLVKSIEDYYFNGNIMESVLNNATDKLIGNITEMLGDALITWFSYEALNYQSRVMNSSSYFYDFEYEGTFSYTFYSGWPMHYGVAHSDELNYLFPLYNYIFSDHMLHNTENDLTMINIMTEMWSSFVTDGVPRAWRIPKWPVFPENSEYLKIGDGKSPDVSVEENFIAERITFWAYLTSFATTHMTHLRSLEKEIAPHDKNKTTASSSYNSSNAFLCLFALIPYLSNV